MLDLYSGTGKSSNIVKDENGGLHVVFHDNLGVASGGPSGTRLKYKFSGNGGESWTAPINISTSVSGLQEYGDYQDLAIDTTNQRLHLVFRAKGTGNYVALMTTACSYSGGGGCLTWPLANPIETYTGSNVDRLAHNYKFPAIERGQNNILHVVWTKQGSVGYAGCLPSGTTTCASTAHWSVQTTAPNWDYIISPQIITNPAGNRIYIIGFRDRAFSQSNVVFVR